MRTSSNRRSQPLIEIRKLAAMDMALHGKRLITAEYAIGVLFPLVLSLLSIRSSLVASARIGWQALAVAWLVGIAVNYIPLVIYAVIIGHAGTAHEEGQPEFAHARRYNIQQLLLLVPFLVAAIALVQERRRRRKVEP